jgi:hypothetical protein
VLHHTLLHHTLLHHALRHHTLRHHTLLRHALVHLVFRFPPLVFRVTRCSSVSFVGFSVWFVSSCLRVFVSLN